MDDLKRGLVLVERRVGIFFRFGTPVKKQEEQSGPSVVRVVAYATPLALFIALVISLMIDTSFVPVFIGVLAFLSFSVGLGSWGHEDERQPGKR